MFGSRPRLLPPEFVSLGVLGDDAEHVNATSAPVTSPSRRLPSAYLAVSVMVRECPYHVLNPPKSTPVGPRSPYGGILSYVDSIPRGRRLRGPRSLHVHRNASGQTPSTAPMAAASVPRESSECSSCRGRATLRGALSYFRCRRGRCCSHRADSLFFPRVVVARPLLTCRQLFPPFRGRSIGGTRIASGRPPPPLFCCTAALTSPVNRLSCATCVWLASCAISVCCCSRGPRPSG